MIIDNKLDMLKSQLTQTRLSNKGVSTNIDQSMVTSTENKNIDMEMFEDQAEAEAKAKKKKKEILEKKKIDEDNEKKLSKKIVRDPMLLLRLI